MFYHHYNRSGFVMTTRTDTWSSHVTTTRFCLAPPGGGHGYRQVLVSMLGCVPVVIGERGMGCEPYQVKVCQCQSGGCVHTEDWQASRF